LFRGYHLNKAEATGLLGVRVSHNLALFDITIFLKHLGHLGLGELGVDASDEKVRSGVDSAIVVVPGCGSILHGAVVVAAWGGGAATTAVILVTEGTRRGAAVVTLVARSFVFVAVAIGGLVVHSSSSHLD
jgi:hypothetical protein